MGVYDTLRAGAQPAGDPADRYRFTAPTQNPTATDPQRFRVRPPSAGPAPVTTPQQPAPPMRFTPPAPATSPFTPSAQTQGGAPRGLVPNARNQDGDRPYPYVPAVRQSGAAEHWRPPTWKEILKDLGWRMLESGIQAVAYEIAYYFGNRRFGIPTYVAP